MKRHERAAGNFSIVIVEATKNTAMDSMFVSKSTCFFELRKMMKNQMPLKSILYSSRKNGKNRTRFFLVSIKIIRMSAAFAWNENRISQRTELNEIIEFHKDFNLGVIRFILFNSKQNIVSYQIPYEICRLEMY